MSRKKTGWSLVFLVVLLIVGGAVTTAYYANLPQNLSQHETIVLGQNRLVPGSQAALRVAVRDSRDGAPLPEAAVQVSLQPGSGGAAQVVFAGNTNELGTADIAFTVPDTEETAYTLTVETQSQLGEDRLQRSVTLTRDYRVLLTTDKPLYQPGQLIHVRLLALSTFDRVPAANQPVDIVIADGKGNTVYRENLTTSEYGVAFTDFQLADPVNTGAYKITANLPTTDRGSISTEKTVTVERYVLPKFAVSLTTDKPFYLPGEHVVANLDAAYFFGKDVADADIQIEGYTFDFQRNELFALQGISNDQGRFSFEFDLPDYIAGTDLEGGLGAFYLQANVTDLTNHTEQAGISFPVSNSRLVIEAIPEGGQFRPGVENILYVLTSYPDGTPAETTLQINNLNNGQNSTVETGTYGLAQVAFTPQDVWQEIQIQARDAQGNVAEQSFYFEGIYQEESVLLRPERPSYEIGDTMNLTVFTSAAAGNVYLDIIREGQTISTRALKIEEGQAEVAVDLSPDMFGTLELHAYKILRSGAIVRDTRLVLVDEADDLAVTFNADKAVYRPGETAVLAINVADARGNGAQSAIGLAIVDEAVFALAEQDPGFAKLYFMLEAELLQPKYELHGFSVPDLILEEPVDDPLLRQAQEGAAKASLAAAAVQPVNFSLDANSHDDAMRIANERQTQYFGNLSRLLLGLTLLLPLTIMGITGVAIWRQGQFWRKLGTAVALGIFLAIFMAGLVWIINELFWRADDTIGIVLIGAFGLALLGLIVTAWRGKDKALGWTIGLSLLFVPLGIAAVLAADEGDFYPDDTFMMLAFAVILLLPLAFLLRASGFLAEKRRGAMTAALLVAMGLLVVPLAGIAMQSPVLGNVALQGGDFDMVVEESAMDLGVTTASADGRDNRQEGGEAPRLREYFPETMLWLPDGVTDEAGRLQLDVPVADSITTWRLTALASTQNGRLGSGTGVLRVFQDFFIDLDLPLALTVGDEVSLPVAVFNYLPEAQTVRLEVQPEPWFDLLDEAEKEITIASNEITVVYFRIRANQFGSQPFQVTAWGAQMSDAIRKQVRVYPDGKQVFFTESDRMSPEAPVQVTIPVPPEAIAGTQQLTVKVYPGLVSQVVEGLDSLFQMPYGCFEQTSSTTYPNILALDYLQTTEQIAPEVQFKAEEYINLGYQRLTSFEVGNKTGSFSLFGDPPPDPMLTAYGLQEFSDMSRVHNVDPALIARTGQWLLSIQDGDGSWSSSSGFRESTLTQQIEKVPVTAYVVWGLSDAGFANESGTQRGAEFLRENVSQTNDPYQLALLANGLVAYDLAANDLAVGELSAVTRQALDKLAGLAAVSDGQASWETEQETVMGSYGDVGSIETTALATLAYLRSDYRADLAQAGLNALIGSKDSFGNWYTTQTTILSLKSFITAAKKSAENLDATVTVVLNNGQTRTARVTADNFDVVQMITFDDVALGSNVVDIQVSGVGNLMYQVTGNYYLPWNELDKYPELVEQDELVAIDVAYDRTELAMNDSVRVDVSVHMNAVDGQADWAIVDLGIPPGFSVNAEDLNTLVAQSVQLGDEYAGTTVEKYELTGRQIIIYLGNLTADIPFSFSYRMTAKYPLRAQTPASNAYDYYNPGVNGEERPLTLTVIDGAG